MGLCCRPHLLLRCTYPASRPYNMRLRCHCRMLPTHLDSNLLPLQPPQVHHGMCALAQLHWPALSISNQLQEGHTGGSNHTAGPCGLQPLAAASVGAKCLMLLPVATVGAGRHAGWQAAGRQTAAGCIQKRCSRTCRSPGRTLSDWVLRPHCLPSSWELLWGRACPGC